MLPLAGCTARPEPAIIAAPTALPTVAATATASIAATATANAEFAREQIIVMRELKHLKSADPARDLETAWAGKDERFIGISGLGISVPGLPASRSEKLAEEFGVNVVKGTTDYIFAPEVAQLNTVAKHYATRYNRLLLAKLDAAD